MEQLHFFPLAVPSNVYGFAHLRGSDRSRVLVATLEKQIFCIEYSGNQFSCNEVHFTYIPNGADIISIDAFQRATYWDTVVGITFFKNSKESESGEVRKSVPKGESSSSRPMSNAERSAPPSNHYYFNIYSSFVAMNRNMKFDLNQIAQDCQTFELDFVPFHLYHTSLRFQGSPNETVFLLSGSDCCVHIYREDIKKQCFYKEKADLFPELMHFRSIALWIDILNIEGEEEEDGLQRLTAIGCEDGWVELFLSGCDDPNAPVPIRSFKKHFDGPILSVRLFRDQSTTPLERTLKKQLHLEESPESTQVHLLVANSYESPIVYRNVLQRGLSQKKALPDTDNSQVDILLATFVADINFDGYNEVLLGKYSKDLLAYRYDAVKREYTISEQMKFANPLQVIAYLDLTGNGIKELLIVTTKGVTIHRHKFSQVVKVLEEKVAKCLKLIDSDGREGEARKVEMR